MLFKVNEKNYINVRHIVRCVIRQDNYSENLWWLDVMLTNSYDLFVECKSKAEAEQIVNKLSKYMEETLV